jgi:hypothetical protein
MLNHLKGETMRKTTFSFVLLLMLSISATVLAAERMKPGLWLMTIKSDAMKNAPQMSPQQMEEMRKRGINVKQMQNGIMENKVCMTKEMVERDRPPMGKNQKDCHMDNFERSGNTYSAKMVCDGPNMQAIGIIKGVHSGLENYSWTTDLKGTSHGHKIDSHQEASGKWLGPDCGDVKPASDYPKKK